MRRTPFLGVLILAGGLLAPRPAAHAEIFTAQVEKLGEPEAVLETMREQGAYELPIEALTVYRSGLDALKRGDEEAAAAAFTEAGTLDPGFPEAHLALARLHIAHSPRLALDDLGRAADATMATFGAQHLLLVNLVFGTLILFALGLMALLAYAAIQSLPRVHHSVAEHLRLRFSSPISQVLAFALLITPVFWGVGWLPFALVWGGLLWSWLHRSERVWIAVLGIPVLLAPLVLWFVSPYLYSPLDPAGRPFLLSRAMVSPATPGLTRALEDALAERPDDPDLTYALAMIQERGGRHDRATATYEKAISLGSSPAAVNNNLGVVAFRRDDYDRAMDLFQQSVAADPAEAASHFNLSQTYAKKLYFEKADQELAAANRLDIDRVRAALRRSNGDAKLVMIEVPLPAGAAWRAAGAAPRRMPTLPGWLAFLFPGSLWFFPLVAPLGFAAGHMVGRRLHRTLPTFPCTNCGQAVCRRCLRRIRHDAYCGACGDALLRIQSASYSKLVLDARIKRKRRYTAIVLRVTDLLIPGLAAARRGKSTLAALIALVTVGGALDLARGGVPVTRLVWIDGGAGPWWPQLPATLVLLAFLVSLVTAFRYRRRQERTFQTRGYFPDEEGRAAGDAARAA